MFRMPLVYPKNLTKLVREYIEKINNSSLLSVLKDMSIMSEYNILGAYAHQFTHQDFFWIDRWDDEKLISETNYNDIFGHYSSREFHQPERYVDLSQADNELSKIINEKI
jgi:hypothetical protein